MARDKDLRARLRALRHRHHTLAREYADAKARVRVYGDRQRLTPGEELEVRTLQRLKLRKKDALQQVQRDLDDVERTLGAPPR